MQVILLGLCFVSLVGAAPQKEVDRNHVLVHHFEKGRKQMISPNENVIQESEKSKDISSGKQMLIKTSHHDSEGTKSAGFSGNAKASLGGSVNKDLPDEEEHGTTFVSKNVQHGRKYRRQDEENKTGDSIQEEVKHLEAKGKRNENNNDERGVQNENIPGVHRTISSVQYSTDYSKLSPKHIKFPYDLEGSGYIDFQKKEDNDFSPSSGEMGVPDTEATTNNSKFLLGKEDNNEVPEKEDYDLNSNGGTSTGHIVETDVSKTPREQKNIIENRILGSSHDIRGSTNYRDLPGEGGDFDANSGNTYQETVRGHHSQGTLKKERIVGQHAREGSNDVIEGTNYKEISEHDKDNTKAAVGSSKREQKTKHDKEKNFSTGNSHGQLIPSHSHAYPLKGINEIKNEENLYHGYNKERSNTKSPGHLRKNPYAGHRMSSSTKSHRVPGKKRFWGPTNAHSNKKFKPPRSDSSDSTSSDQSSDSDGDQSDEYFEGGSN